MKKNDGTSGFEHITGASTEATLDATSSTILSRIIFDAPASGTRARGRARVADEKVVEVKIIEPVQDMMQIIPPNDCC